MAGKKLTYDIFLEATSRGLQRAMSRGGESAKQMSTTINRSIKSANQAMGRMITSAAKIGTAFGVAGAAAGVYAFTSIMRDAVSLANEQTKAERKLGAVLKATGGAAGYNLEELKKMASGMQDVTTVGDEVILNGMSILATFKNVSKDGFKRATEAALDMANVMDQDLKSSMVQVGKALNDPIAGISALGRVGVQFTDSQKEMIKTLAESGNLLQAQDIILKELESQFGGAAKAAREEFGGASTAAANSLGDLKEEMGFVITKNAFFIEGAKAAEQQFKNWTGEINKNRGALMQQAKDGALALVNLGQAAIAAADAVFRAGNAMQGAFRSVAALGLTGFAAWNKVASAVAAVTDLLGITTGASEKFALNAGAAFEAAGKVFDDAKADFSAMSEGSKALGAASGQLDKLRAAMEQIDAGEVKDAADETKKAADQLVNIGGKWVQMSKSAMDAAVKDTEYAGRVMAGEFEEIGIDWGRVWDTMQKDGIDAVDKVEERIDKLTNANHVVNITVKEQVQRVVDKATNSLVNNAITMASGAGRVITNAVTNAVPTMEPALAGAGGGSETVVIKLDLSAGGSPVSVSGTRAAAAELIRQFRLLEKKSS